MPLSIISGRNTDWKIETQEPEEQLLYNAINWLAGDWAEWFSTPPAERDLSVLRAMVAPA